MGSKCDGGSNVDRYCASDLADNGAPRTESHAWGHHDADAPTRTHHCFAVNYRRHLMPWLAHGLAAHPAGTRTSGAVLHAHACPDGYLTGYLVRYQGPYLATGVDAYEADRPNHHTEAGMGRCAQAGTHRGRDE